MFSSSASSSTQSLQYLKIANRVNSGGGRTITGTIDDVKFYDNSISKASDSKLGSGAYSFDGSNDNVSTTETVLDFQATDSFSIAFWFKTTDTGEAGFVSRWNTSNNGWLVLKDTGTTASFRLSSNWGGGNAIRAVATNNAFSDGNWHHLAVTYGGSGHSSIKMYVDGTAQTLNVNLTGTVGTITYGTNLAFGVKEATGSFSDKYDGELDDIGIWKRELTATEIGKLANNNIDGSDGWVSVAGSSSTKNITVDASNQELDFKFYGGGANGNGSVAYVDIGAGEISNTDWALQFTINYSTQVGNQGVGWVGLSDSIANSTTTQDGANVVFMNNDNQVFGKALNGQTPNDNWGTGTSATLSTDTPYYITIKRTDASNGTIDIKTGSHSGSSLTNYPASVSSFSSNVTGLRYIKVMDREGYTSTTNGDVGTIKDIKFWKNTDDTSTTPTSTYSFTAGNPQLVSSLSNKANLKAHYTMDSTSKSLPTATLSEDFSSSSAWTLHSSSSISGGSLTCNNTGESYRSTGLGKPTNLTWEFTWTRNSGDAGDTSSLLLTSHTGGYSDPSSGHTNVQFYMANGNVTTLSVRKNSGSGNVQTECHFGVGSSSVNIQPTGTTRYYRITKNGSVWTMKKFTSASDRTNDTNAEASATATQSSTADSTWNSGSGNLTYLLVDGHGSGTKNYTIDDVVIYEGTTEGCQNDASATSDLDELSGVKSGSVFLQTNDTPKYYWYDGTSWKIDGTTAFIPSGSGLHVGGSGSSTSTFTATDYVWASSSVSTIGESRSYSSGAGNKNSFWIAGGSNAHTSRIFDGSSWSSTTALDTERRDTTAGGGNTSNAIIACGRNQSGTEISTSSKYNGTAWSSAGTVTGGAGEHVGGAGTGSSFLATGGSTRNDKCDKYDGTSWSASAVLPQTTVRSHNQAGKSSASAHTAGGNYASSFTWDGTSWATSTNYTQGGDTTVRYPTGGGTADHHWLMGGLDETGGTSTLNNTELWNGSSWTAKGALPTGNYAGLGDGSDF